MPAEIRSGGTRTQDPFDYESSRKPGTEPPQSCTIKVLLITQTTFLILHYHKFILLFLIILLLGFIMFLRCWHLRYYRYLGSKFDPFLKYYPQYRAIEKMPLYQFENLVCKLCISQSRCNFQAIWMKNEICRYIKWNITQIPKILLHANILYKVNICNSVSIYNSSNWFYKNSFNLQIA